jgi:hypothetical protein
MSIMLDGKPIGGEPAAIHAARSPGVKNCAGPPPVITTRPAPWASTHRWTVPSWYQRKLSLPGPPLEVLESTGPRVSV